MPENSTATPKETSAPDAKAARAALGGEVKWDNDSLDPNKRKSIAEDPDGKENAKLGSKK